jgi:FkbM family methyltransferase
VKEVNGWWLPDDDHYFGKFVAGGPKKSNGFQREHLEAAFKHVPKFDYAVDVGAHVGFWAKDMADRFKHVYCFEPSAKTLGCLVKNLSEYDNVSISHVAIGDGPRKCIINRDDRRQQNSGSEFVRIDTAGSIDMTSLDEIGLPGCDLLKVDVEGFEYAVLLGARKLIKKFKPVVIMECDKKFAKRRFGWSDFEAEGYLKRTMGYKEVAHMRPDKVFVPAAEE